MNRPLTQQYLDIYATEAGTLYVTEAGTFPVRIDSILQGKAEETYVSGKILPKEREAALAALAALKKAKDDFDGQGTLVPDSETLDTAYRLIKTCFGSMYPTNIYPGMDRSLVLAYAAADLDHVLHITVDRDMLFVSKIINGGKIQKLGKFAVPIEFIVLPTEIRAVLPAYRR